MNEFSLSNLTKIKEAYDNEGFFIVRNVLDTDLINELDQHIDWLIARHPDLRPERLGHWLVAEDPFWIRFISDQRLLNVASLLVGPNIAFLPPTILLNHPEMGRQYLGIRMETTGR